MKSQLSLLDEPHAPYRREREASREGAAAIEPHLARLERLALEAYQRAGDRGLTDRELAALIGVQITTAIPRRHTLIEKGLVTVDPIARRRSFPGAKVRVGAWAITEEGRMAA